MSLNTLILGVAFALSAWHPVPAQQPGPAVDLALVGAWRLDLGRTHYGPGVDNRRSESMRCDVREATLRCTVDSVRTEGGRTTARFGAPLGGASARVVGLEDIDAVRLRPHRDGIVDATFSYRGKPVYGYRAYRSADGETLFIVSVDPATRAALNSIVVYQRVAPAASRTSAPGGR